MCTHGHLDFKAVCPSNRKRNRRKKKEKREKKLLHISGIFQLMMCGCGSTAERESYFLCCLCFVHWGPRAAFQYAVHTLATVAVPPFFHFTVYSLCAALAHFSFLQLPIWICTSSSIFFLSIFMAMGGLMAQAANGPFCRTSDRTRGKVKQERNNVYYNVADCWRFK